MGEIRARKASRRRFTLRAFLPHSSRARRREKVNSDVEKQIRSLESRPRRLVRAWRGEEQVSWKWVGQVNGRGGSWASYVRARGRKEKNLYGEQFAGLIDGGGYASVKSSRFRFKKNRPVSLEMPDIHRSLPWRISSLPLSLSFVRLPLELLAGISMES